MTPVRFRLALPLLLLAGCGHVLFESQPGDRLADCDPDFVGSWRFTTSEKIDAADRDPMYLLVGDGCEPMHLVGDGERENLKDAFRIGFSTVDAMRILTVRPIADTVDGNTGGNRWRQGHALFRYDAHDGEIRLHPADPVRVAHLLIDGELPGRVEKIAARPEDGVAFDVFVAGNRDGIAGIVRNRDIFDDEFKYVLTSVSPEEAPKAAGTP